MVRIELTALRRQHAIQMGKPPLYVFVRLDSLEGLCRTLLEYQKSANHRPWITEHRRDLSVRTPFMVLFGARRSDDSHPLHIKALAQKVCND